MYRGTFFWEQELVKKIFALDKHSPGQLFCKHIRNVSEDVSDHMMVGFTYAILGAGGSLRAMLAAFM